MKSKIFSIVILSLFLFACSKYQDGPIISFRSKKVRLEGSWKYDAIIYEDQDLTVTDHMPDTVMSFTKSGGYSDNYGYTGTWKFTGSVNLTVIKSNNNINFEKTWEITKLSNTQLWLRINKVDYHLKPQ
jgi:hypothetical protein